MRLDIRLTQTAPQLTNLTATAGVGSVALKWDVPTSPYHKSTEVWMSATSDGANPQLLATVNDYTYVVVDASATAMYYWVRSVSIFGRSDGPVSNMALKAGNQVTTNLAKTLSLGASSQIFSISKSGAASPGTVNLFASSQNMTGTPVWSTTFGSALLTNPANANGFQKDIDLANMYTDQVTVQVAMGGLIDQVTISKIRDGVDTITGMLTNEAANVPADFTGAVIAGSLANAGGNYIVYNGTAKMTTGVAYSIVAPTSGLTMSITTAGVYSVTGLTVDSASATVRAVYNGVTIDKVYTIARAKQGVNGTNGTNGANGADGAPGTPGTNGTNGTNGINGTNGQRGTVNLVQFGISAWNAASATSYVISQTGTAPMNGDIITQCDATHGFTYFYTAGSWVSMNAYIAGNLLIDGSVQARALAANSITTDKLVVGSKPGVLNDDPMLEDVNNAWTMQPGINVNADGFNAWYAACARYFATSTLDACVYSTRKFLINPNKTYSLTANLLTQGGNDRLIWIFVDFFDSNGNLVGNTGWGGARSGYVYAGIPPANYWSRQGGQFGASVQGRLIPSNVASARVGVWFQYSGSGTSNVIHDAQDIRLEQVNGSVLIEDGAIKANHLKVNTVDAMTGLFGVMRSATSGARIEIADNRISGFRLNNTLSFQITS